MKRINVILLLAAVLFCASCNLFSNHEIDAEYPGDEYVAWVEKVFVGGRLCDPEDDYMPPDTRKLLHSHRIAVFDTGKTYLGTCAACFACPSYAARHYALIHTDNVEKAEEIGFTLSDGPN